jgi:hypothetical protein
METRVLKLECALPNGALQHYTYKGRSKLHEVMMPEDVASDR